MKKPPPIYTLEHVLHAERDTTYKHFENASSNPFQADSDGIPLVNAWWLAEAALLAYWKPADAVRIFEEAGLRGESINAEATGTDCYVATHKDYVIVAFRGTQPDQWADILADANIVLVPWRNGFVHLGFKAAFEAIRPRLDPVLQRLLPGRTLWFCGHSLGAALATLAADHYDATRGVCTLGSPRVGDPRFARAFNARFSGRSLRYVNDHDVVTHVPPPIGYEHVDAGRFIAADGSITPDAPPLVHFFTDLIGNPGVLLETVDALGKGTLLHAPQFLLDHMPKAYAIEIWNDYDAHR